MLITVDEASRREVRAAWWKVWQQGQGGDWDNGQREGGSVVDACGDESWGHSGVVAFGYTAMLGCMSHGVLAGLLVGHELLLRHLSHQYVTQGSSC